jgi:formamidopyrimidine-DNA glycosylase
VPELPEVETIRTGLEPGLVGRRFEHVEIRDPRLTRPFEPEAVAAELEGERVAALERRGKYLIVRFDSGRVLLVHLRMTGSFRHVRTSDRDAYARAVVEPYLEPRVGVELLEGGRPAPALAKRLAGRRAAIKALLLDQRLFAGVGNIYADEALWWARIHPLRPGGELDAGEVRELVRGVRRALRTGIARQGSTLSEYRGPDGAPGRMQHEFRVYGREGEPCSRCGTPIEKTRAGGRGTWYCPGCQK